MKGNGGFLIGQVKQRQGRIFERLLTDSGIQEFNGAQGRILYVLWQQDNIPIVELSRKTSLAKTTLTSMLDRMEQSNLIERVYDKSDRRQIRISLTPKARELNHLYNKVSSQMAEIFDKDFSTEEIEQFETYLTRILDNLIDYES